VSVKRILVRASMQLRKICPAVSKVRTAIIVRPHKVLRVWWIVLLIMRRDMHKI
jgi:hypothetical protein